MLSNSPLVSYTKLSPNCNKPRNKPITKITPHHMAGNLTVEACGQVFFPSSRGASSNYGIGTDGRIGMYVEEKNRAWTSSSGPNDHQAITIEVANDVGAPDWHVSDKALESLINLCVDICKRNNIPGLVFTGDANGSLTYHNMFAATLCPGPYLQSKFPYIAEEVNKRLGNGYRPYTPPVNVKPPIVKPATGARQVKIIDDALNIRSGPGVNYPDKSQIKDHGIYTISEEVTESGALWGKLKSGVGWIRLGNPYTTL